MFVSKGFVADATSTGSTGEEKVNVLDLVRGTDKAEVLPDLPELSDV